jgi:putative alpha-1,2-mannosidase
MKRIQLLQKTLRLSLVFCLSSFFSYSQTNYAKLVNPFIGTGGHGHTYPGATMPHGMVQLSPDTRLEGWDGCGGYHYSDNYIYGFSHTHLSGTGIPD